ncbi:hypothetical protein MKX01_026345, partial [Papaver californicum]
MFICIIVKRFVSDLCLCVNQCLLCVDDADSQNHFADAKADVNPSPTMKVSSVVCKNYEGN